GARIRQVDGNLLDLAGEQPARDVFVMWLGSQVNVRGLLLQGRAFDVVLPADGDRIIDPNVQLIPCLAVVSLVRRTLDRDPVLTQLIERAREGGARVWL